MKLAASKLDGKAYVAAHNNTNSAFNQSLIRVSENQAEWTSVEGIEVLRVKESNFVAVPNNGKKNSPNFSVIDLNDRSDVVTQLSKKEVSGWLTKAYLA